jgi:peptide/nickel transport system ATP-binding protein
VTVLEVADLSVRYAARGGPPIRAVEGVSLAVARGETLGLVGESGCGKSSLANAVVGLVPAAAGSIRVAGAEVVGASRAALRDIRRHVQMVFQDPATSLNPRMSVGAAIGEPLAARGLAGGAALRARVAALLAEVGLRPEHAGRYPHQFSGGQRQRIGIARALAVQPDFLVCDEAVAALDVSIQAQIINLFMDLRARLGLTYLFISHDLGVIAHVADRVAIMYLGRIVEAAPAEEIFARANHPYTQALLAEVPRIEARHRSFAAIGGELPSPLAPPGGCHFHPRCPHARPRCATEPPVLREVAPGHRSACHLNDAP